ncbi:hypothetical protein CCUS01_00703 [Colletotrichum cuscutae]|uniref:Uncharacterized protein n=1 Tax=Colletotrichum cuscutae TaxID=1209917 RepID=A0AAI9VCX2_9PEZI|nr:hypothetical protein CCUS01_00703 [Colletotrichum cuscutae]
MQSSRLKGVKYQKPNRSSSHVYHKVYNSPLLNILAGNGKDNFSRLQEIKGSIENSIKGDMQKLLLIPQRSLKHLAQRSILRALEFDTMYYCYDTICDAHEKTFRWILADDFNERCLSDSGTEMMKETNLKVDATSALAEDNALVICTGISHMARIRFQRRHIRQKLTRWLSSVSGVFHFSAKLGAGKSTSRKPLDTWAGEFNLTRISAGDKTLVSSGKVLSAHPDLTPHDLPSFWETVYTSSWPAGERMHISLSQALQGFDRLFRGSDISQNNRFCLLIDGLDELHETTECSYSDLTEMIYRWSSLTSRLPKLMLCKFDDNKQSLGNGSSTYFSDVPALKDCCFSLRPRQIIELSSFENKARFLHLLDEINGKPEAKLQRGEEGINEDEPRGQRRNRSIVPRLFAHVFIVRFVATLSLLQNVANNTAAELCRDFGFSIN